MRRLVPVIFVGICALVLQQTQAQCIHPLVVGQPENTVGCLGETAKFAVLTTGSTPMIYTWYHDGEVVPGMDSPELAIYGVVPGDSGAYWVMVQNACGADMSAVAYLTVIDPPAITSGPAASSSCIGDTVIFSITVAGTGPFFIEWATPRSGGAFGPPNSTSMRLTNVTEADAGPISVRVKNGCAAEAVASGMLQVLTPPTVARGPMETTVCVGEPLLLSVRAMGSQPFTYQWFHDGVPVPGGVRAVLDLGPAVPKAAGTYMVTVTNSCGSASATSIVTVNGAPSIVEQPLGAGVNPGGSTGLSVTAVGAEPLTYQWVKDGSPITGATGSTLTITSAGASDAGVYHVVVSNGCGSVDSASVPVLVAMASDRSWAPVSGGMNGPVYALLSFDDGSGQALFAAGAFTVAGGVPASRVAKWTNGAWQPINGGMNAPVHALGVFDLGTGPTLYAAGEFTTAGAVSANRIAKWNGTGWAPLGGGIDNGTVRTMHLFDGPDGVPRLYAGGSFSMAGSNGGIASWDGFTWTAVDGGVSGPVYALEVFDDGTGPKLFVGGGFSAGGVIPDPMLVRWDGVAWSSIGGPVPTDLVRTMLAVDDVMGGSLYVAGDFQGFNGLDGIGRWDGSEWFALAEGLGPGPVHALAQYDDGTGPGLYAGGNFTMSGFMLVNRVARWQNGQWSEMNMGRDDLVRALAVHVTEGRADLYSGGFFMTAGGSPALFVARWKAQFTLSLAQPLGMGSLAVMNSFGDPSADYFTAFSFDPQNGTSPGGGPWNGLFITADDLLSQFLFGVPPFVGTLDPEGISLFWLPPGAISDLAGMTGFGVSVIYDPILLVPGVSTPVANLTVQ